MVTYVELSGEPSTPSELRSLRARQLAYALQDSSIAFASLVECRLTKGTDIVVLDVEVEVPQRPTYPILPFERLAIAFDSGADDIPEVLALREDFPHTPHVNLRNSELPRSLCLYDESFRDVKRRWTPSRFVELIRHWLALTAKGKLHQEDQPLEPLMFGQVGTIVLPADVLNKPSAEGPNRLTITATGTENGKMFHLADRSERRPEKEGFRVVASVHRCEPQEHGIIRCRPSNVRDLAGFVKPARLDLLAELRARLGEWKDEASKDPTILDYHVALIIVMPKTRRSRQGAESPDVWAFLSTDTVREALKKLGLFDTAGGVLGYIIGGDDTRTGEDLKLDLLNPSFRLSKQSAAALNGVRPESPKITVVGVGALGSQVAMNMARSGFGTGSLIDDDRMLSHNLARHALIGSFVGYYKAEAVAFSANSLVDNEKSFQPIVADVIEPGPKAAEVRAALDEADLILDMSASVTVARHLTLKEGSQARRASLFLSPSGEDLVLLAEDRDRQLTLDSLEMQYYRSLVADERLQGHFRPRDERRRYGQSCRDITSDLPQELVGLHAAIGSRAVRDTVASPSARITVWRADSDGNVRRVDVEVAPSMRHRIGDWTVSVDARLICEIARLRESKLPTETGGVLLGSFDLENKIIYIAHTIASPPDSEERRTLYIRGCKGLRRKVEEVGRTTDGMLEYIGEWHSHPKGYSTAPSDHDLEAFAWLTELMNGEGLPAMMMIAGDGGYASCYVGQMAQLESLLPRQSLREWIARGEPEGVS